MRQFDIPINITEYKRSPAYTVALNALYDKTVEVLRSGEPLPEVLQDFLAAAESGDNVLPLLDPRVNAYGELSLYISSPEKEKSPINLAENKVKEILEGLEPEERLTILKEAFAEKLSRIIAPPTGSEEEWEAEQRSIWPRGVDALADAMPAIRALQSSFQEAIEEYAPEVLEEQESSSAS
jgi:hypothetical protein